MAPPLPLSVVSAVDPVLRDSVSLAVVLDVPGAVVVSYRMTADGFRRTLSDVTGTLEDELVALEHVCVNCAMREDVIPALLNVARAGRWKAAALALPVGAEPVGPVEMLASIADEVPVTSVVAVADLGTLVEDVLGDDLLRERGLALAESDERAVGEVLGHQLQYADVIVSAGGTALGTELLDHLRSPESVHLSAVDGLESAQLFEPRHEVHVSAARLDHRRIAPAEVIDHQVWTIDLLSPRPFHPRRLMASIERLGAGRIRSRGRFWLPTRPGTMCVWDGGGGQLSIGDGGPWGDVEPSTRIVVTGVGAERQRVSEAFGYALLTEAETGAEILWVSMDDGFGPWLGDQARAS